MLGITVARIIFDQPQDGAAVRQCDAAGMTAHVQVGGVARARNLSCGTKILGAFVSGGSPGRGNPYLSPPGGAVCHCWLPIERLCCCAATLPPATKATRPSSRNKLLVSMFRAP